MEKDRVETKKELKPFGHFSLSGGRILRDRHEEINLPPLHEYNGATCQRQTQEGREAPWDRARLPETDTYSVKTQTQLLCPVDKPYDWTVSERCQIQKKKKKNVWKPKEILVYQGFL